jgi:hypothetical protein
LYKGDLRKNTHLKNCEHGTVGMLIATDRFLSPGRRLEAAVDGLFQVHARVSWKPIVTGRIVRSESREVPLEGSEDLHPFISDGLIIPVLREAAGPPYS